MMRKKKKETEEGRMEKGERRRERAEWRREKGEEEDLLDTRLKKTKMAKNR